jgi:hypothetical protein
MATMDDKVDDFITTMLEEVDAKIQEIDNSKVMRSAAKLIEKKTKLMATRRALLGGNAMTGGSSGTRITQGDVVGAITGNGDSPATIAERLHTTEAVVRGHLNRGKDERFLKKNNLWYLRDPEAGVNTEEDISDGED